MPIAPRIEAHLQRHNARYDVVPHPRSESSIETAAQADVPGDRLVKAVVLQDDDGKLLAVLPSTRSVHIGHLATQTGRRLRLADEEDLGALFPDCKAGAVPPIGAAYGLRTLMDDSVEALQDVFFEAGDHETLVHMTAAQFMALVGTVERAHFGAAERRHIR
jgi:Ala-tRNA(Pro) deacylase